ncbi:MAG: hypothetical protein DMD96_03875 [Candidatus Rokuibacteriota bacterium]|nr:MAG: hypothetical protein DMD96_03875 [Candidatus Rokubacteria bacterium]
MTETTERRIPHTDLTLVAFRCLHCKAELTLDFTNETQRQGLLGRKDTGTCSFCGQNFDRWLLEALRAFQEMRDKLKDTNAELVFRVAERPRP